MILSPSANPDGTDKVTDCIRSLGKPWEGDGMPWLYHKAAAMTTTAIGSP